MLRQHLTLLVLGLPEDTSTKLYANQCHGMRKHFLAECCGCTMEYSLPTDTDFSSLNSFKLSISTVLVNV